MYGIVSSIKASRSVSQLKVIALKMNHDYKVVAGAAITCTWLQDKYPQKIPSKSNLFQTSKIFHDWMLLTVPKIASLRAG